MAGTWESQNKVIPGAYINLQTNTPLSITAGDRGTVVIAQELSVGTDNEIYEITASAANYPENATAADKKLTGLALLGAKTVLLYKLPSAHTDEHVEAMLAALKTVDFDVLVYPYAKSGTSASTAQQTIATWVKSMQDDDGKNVTAVLPNYAADSEYVINSVQGVILSDGSTLTAYETAAWIGGITAGSSITKSNTAQKFVGAIDVVPRMTRSEQETAIKAGKLLLDVDRNQNVTVVADINSLTSTTQTKGDMMKQNRSVRTACGIRSDIQSVWDANIKGKYDNNATGRSIFKGMLVEYFTDLERRGAIQNFDSDNVTVGAGTAINAVLVNCGVQLVGSMELAYINVNLT
ncbi:phage tail sheath protein [Clostridium sp. OF09-36]|uniref:phage tail sheath subtilisin-like domain-containing protein n=1 Tax=Clostridium sp. OF09-36 TaxID=2292310 RepID=UPI000E51A043|nr:phage tail sheath subtilisin-like domain-containing protein [Clostridium sp. OF09-36]RHV84242.1 phage tail sheath protein [Clostridium sp. OF09-36]